MKEEKGFLYASHRETERNNKIVLHAIETQLLFVTKRKPMVDKRKNTLFLPNNFCFAFSLLYLDSDIPVHFNESKSTEHKTGCYCREKRTEFI